MRSTDAVLLCRGQPHVSRLLKLGVRCVNRLTAPVAIPVPDRDQTFHTSQSRTSPPDLRLFGGDASPFPRIAALSAPGGFCPQPALPATPDCAFFPPICVPSREARSGDGARLLWETPDRPGRSDAAVQAGGTVLSVAQVRQAGRAVDAGRCPAGCKKVRFWQVSSIHRPGASLDKIPSWPAPRTFAGRPLRERAAVKDRALRPCSRTGRAKGTAEVQEVRSNYQNHRVQFPPPDWPGRLRRIDLRSGLGPGPIGSVAPTPGVGPGMIRQSGTAMLRWLSRTTAARTRGTGDP